MTIKAMAEALFHDRRMAISADQVVENLQEHFSNIDGNKPQEIGMALYGLLAVLGGPFFLAAPPAIRKNLIRRRLKNSRIDLFQDIARTKGVILAGYYGHWQPGDEEENFDNPVFADLNFELPAQRDRSALGERPVRREPCRDLTAKIFVGHEAIPEETDVIVIGSGAGGAVAAAAVADEGHEVLIVEAGRHYPSSRITHEEARMTARLFKDGALQTTSDRDIIVFQGRVVGGSTVINNGICLRMKHEGLVHPDAEDVYDTWSKLGAPISEELFFRGLVLRSVEKRFGATIGVAASTVAFVLPHYTYVAWRETLVIFVAIGIVGLALGLVVQRTGRLGPAIIAHMVFNSVAVLATLAPAV